MGAGLISTRDDGERQKTFAKRSLLLPRAKGTHGRIKDPANNLSLRMTNFARRIMEIISLSRASVLTVTIISAGTKFISYLYCSLAVCCSARMKFLVVMSASFITCDGMHKFRRNRGI